MSADAKKIRAIQRLLRPIEDDEGENGEDPEDVNVNNGKPDQIRYYKGELKSIILDSRDRMRFFLFTVQPFPTGPTLVLHARQFYVAACQERYRSKYRGKFVLLGSSICC